MTITKNHSTSGEFELGHYRFHRDDQRRLIFIPSGPDLDGYLAFDQKENNFVQVRLLKTEDAEKRATYQSTWKQIQEKNDCNLCPEILAYGEEENVPYYVSSLPAGEPVSFFVKRGGPLPPEVAVKMVLKFLRSLKTQNPVSYEAYEMSPETLWISRSADEPRIIFSDFSPAPREAAEAVNAKLCLELLKYLSGNPPFNEIFQTMIGSIENGPRTLESFIKRLEDYTKSNPASEFWTDYNQPSPILNQLVEPHISMQSVTSEPAKEKIEKIPYDRPLWQYALGIGSAAILFGVLGMLGLIFITKNKPAPISEINQPVGKTGNAKEPALETPLRSFPEPIDPKQQAAEPEIAAAEPKKTEPPVKQELPPLPPIDEGDTIQAKPLTPIQLGGDIQKILPVKIKIADAITTREPSEIALTKPPVKEPTAEEIMNQLANEASLARANNETFKAIEKEIDVLKLSPKSVDAKLRLNEDLSQLQQSPGRKYTNDELEVLKKTAAFNPKAFDIQVQHFRNTGNWNFEVASLVQHGKSGRPDKLREAGERVFQNPSATEADQMAAREYFIEAAELGDSSAQFFAGECMVLGRGGNKNLPQGTNYLRKAIDQGDARAMDLLGVSYVRGWGVSRDDSRAVELFEAAVAGGNIPAYYNLGARFAQGQGVERDPARAAELFGKGSSKGNAHCMLVYARCLEAGYGLDRNVEKAKYWFSKSAEKGNSEAIEWCEENNHDYLKFLADS